MFTKGLLFSSAFSWEQDLSIRDNVKLIMHDYIPYGFNVLTRKTHLADAKKLISFLDTNKTSTDLEIYLLIQKIRQELHDESGEFKKRLNFCVRKIEEQNVLFKTMGETGQAIKSLFCMNQ